MLLCDYFRSEQDKTWQIARTCGIEHGVIRLPEDEEFDLTCKAHWDKVYKRFIDFGIKPIIIEPMPNSVHEHIKTGDEKRDEAIEKVIKMLPIMKSMGTDMICFNFMAHIGWLRTSADINERGGALVTGFDTDAFKTSEKTITKEKIITEEKLWDNYGYFIKAVIPEAEKHGIRLALHPDDPPRHLGGVKRIMTSAENIHRAIYSFLESPSLGLTMCQANFHIMGEDIREVIKKFKNKIMFIHFRNTTGEINSFRETFHDNGDIDMVRVMMEYIKQNINVPIRVDHVPTMPWEEAENAGYDADGRMFAIGYLKGIVESVEKTVDLA